MWEILPLYVIVHGKASTWCRQGLGLARAKGGRRTRSNGKDRNTLFAVVPLLALVIGCLSISIPSAVAAEANGGVLGDAGGRGGLGGESFWRWGSRGRDEAARQDDTVVQQQLQQRRRIQTAVTADVVLSDISISLLEGGAVTYTVVLSDDPGTTFNVNISTASSEIILFDTQLIFSASDWNISQPVTVSTIDDEVVEPLREVSIIHAVDIPGDFEWSGVFSPSGASLTVRVFDNDVAEVVTADVVLSESSISVSEGEAGANYTVVLSEDPGTTVSVNITTDSSDIILSKSQLVFSTSDWSTVQPVTVSAVDDEAAESLLEVPVTHSVYIPGNFEWDGVFSPSGATVTVQVFDNDGPGIVTADVVLSESSMSVSEGGGGAAYTVVLSENPGTTVNINISTTSSEILLSESQLVFLASDWSTVQPVTISAVDDDTVEPLLEVLVIHTVDIPGNFEWDGVFSPSGASLTARIYDNDEAGVLASASALYMDEGGFGTYNVKLMGSPSQDVTVTATASNAYVTIATPAFHKFTSSTWDSARTFTVSAVDDDVQTSEAYAATISHTVSSEDVLFDGAAVTFFPSSKISVVIYDDDDGCYRECEVGKWASPCNGSYECASCSPGYYCAGGCVDPVACAAGTSLGEFGASEAADCEECPDGYYASEEGSASCFLCPAGYFCASADVAPVACPAGGYASAGSLSCSDCPNGYYNALEAQEFCQACPAGFECPAKDSTPSRCSSGSYSNGNATACEPCPAGYFCSSTGSSPAVCNEGSYSLDNWAYCVACPPGAYCFNTAQEPTACPAGTASSGGSIACTACTTGTYAESEGSTECTICPAGKSCLNQAAEPVDCAGGTFSQIGDGNCSSCAQGTYSGEGATSCQLCPIGYSCNDPAASPTLCEEGFFSSGGVVLACEACPAGTYTSSLRNGCLSCSAGYECPDPTAGQVSCEEGEYSTAGATACTLCPAGTYCIAPFTVAQACGAGTYSTSGSSNCTVCPGGSSCATPSDLPVACAEGYYSADGATACTVCPAGSYCPGPPRDEESKAPCPRGTYAESGASSCSECPKGYYCPDPAQGPEACPNGYYAHLGNMTQCDRCTAGNYCPSAAMPEQPCPEGYYSGDSAVSCTACPPGYACPTAATGFIACSPGTFSVGLASNCTSCPPGYFCPNTEAAEFYECPDGTYSVGDATSCEVCSPGFYCPEKTVEAELPCPDGFYSSGAATSCTECEAGYACTADGSSRVACEPGYYSQAGATTCIPCPAGSYCPDTDNDTVFPCPEGSFSLGLAQSCTPCQAGYYCPYPDSAEDFPCAAGSFAVGGKHLCTDCPAGFTCSSRSTDQMEECGLGYYSLLGEPLCTACPAGYHCPLAKDSPIACDPGYYSSAASTACTLCPAGYFCDDPEAPPQPCEVGYYSGGGAAICSACQPGYRCPEASVSATPAGSECPEGTYCNPARTLIECPAGTYGNTTAAASQAEGCQACTEGYYCTDTGNTLATRTICPAGYYCPSGSSSPTACDAGLFNDNTGSWSNDACMECPAGYYCPRASASSMASVCPAGYYCPVNTPASDSYPCPAGTYSGETGRTTSSQCATCTVGKYCPEGSTSPTNCQPGTYLPSTGATDASACQECEPGWACDSVAMSGMTTLCDPGHYCPSGTSYPNQYPCPAGTYTDSTDLTSALQCSACPERKACLSGSTSNDWLPCGSGYWCQERTPTTTSYPCSAGSYTNRTDLAADSECYPCPLGMWCGGSGSVEPDGPCKAGYFCPLRTAAATDNPCPAGTYSDSTSLYLEEQCEDCPPGYYCPQASTAIEPCPAGTYSPYNATEDAGPDSWPSCTACSAGSYCVEASVAPVACGVGMYSSAGSDSCAVCEAGHYCGSNETSAVDMLTGGGSWDSASDSAGVCFNGTYCAAGMTRAPDLTRDACPVGYYCPAGTESPLSCPSGTYNPHTGMDDLADCIVSPAGYYAIEGSANLTGPCDPGFYCPAGSTGPEQVPCPQRYYRSNTAAESRDDCAYCVSGGYCPSGSTEPLDCPRGYYCVSGVAEPEPCPLGTYGNSTGLRKISDCSSCDPGNYCDQRGLASPAGPCDPGYYCLEGSYTSAPNAPGSPLSIEDTDIGGLCPAGGYCPIGSSYQQPCPAGTFNNFSGAANPADCSDCPPGFYCSGTSNPEPTGTCYAGHYCTGGASTPTQNRTERGYYTPPGAAIQYPCLPGTYNGQEEQESCLDCIAGYYCQSQATISPVLCPVGSYCPVGSDVPIPCPAGTYGPLNAPGLQSVTQCTNCTAGKYCESNGLTAVTGDCLAGYYCSSGAILSNPVDQSYGDLCTPGHYCEEGSEWPEPCPTGTYYGAEGNDGDHWANNTISGTPYRTYCTLCSAGNACNDTGLRAPDVECAEGYFCKLGASDPKPYCEAGEGLCTYGVCPAGYYCPASTSDPVVCPPGEYMNHTGAAECFTCPERYYCDGSFPRGYEECTAGHYCETGTDVPKNCPAGTFSAQTKLASADECTPCTAGSFCAQTGLTAVQGECTEGYYCPSGSEDSLGKIGVITDHVCPEGQYCPAGSAFPEPCPVGTYRPSEQGTAEEDCTACSEGFYCETTGLVTPTGPCLSGHYCKRKVDTEAPIGGVTTVFGMEQGGDLCAVGTYCPNGTATPLPCLAGTYNDLEGQGECFDCPAGYYCLAGATAYDNTPCPAGYYCPDGTRFAIEFPCPPGTYANTTMTSSEDNCIDAPAGSYVAGSASQTVTGICEEGFYCSGGSSSATPSCVETVPGICDTGGPCVAGQYCPAGSPFWQVCPGGSYCADATGAISGLCSEGYYCMQGSKTPTPENVIDEGGNVIGDVCPAGYYCPEGSVSPFACPSGTFSGSTGNTDSSACLLCTPGFVCPDASTAEVTEPCPAGFYCPAGTAEATLQCDVAEACPVSSGEPVDCAAGTYQHEPGQDSCLQCPEGYYCTTRTETPVDCPLGSYCPAGTEWGTQYQCPVGTFGGAANLVNITMCITCTPGSYCETAGLDAPTGECDAGYYCSGGATIANPDSGSAAGYQGDTCVDRSNGTTNDVCPPGHYCPQGSSAPEPCPEGTASSSFSLVDVADCPPCPPSFYCPEVGTHNATIECTEGFYCPGGDVTPTEVCPIGHYCPAGSASPRGCEAGTYQGNTGRDSCIECPDGYFCPTATDTPVDCPPGSYCLAGTEWGTQYQCPVGTFGGAANLANITMCSSCTPGSYCETAGLDAPTGECDAGYYCGAGATVVNPDSSSAAGYKGDTCVDRGDGATNDVCPPGHYCPQGSSAPEPCPKGTASSSFSLVDAADCSPCPPGFYCPEVGTNNATLECTEGFYCPGGDVTPTEACPAGYYCPTGSASPVDCVAGTYQNQTRATGCDICPDRSYCEATATKTLACPAGFYCPEGTEFATEFPCPNGTYSNETGLAAASECALCPPGRYCGSEGLSEPEGLCGAGYYCALGATSPVPADDTDASVGGLCAAGYVCIEGAESPQPVDGKTGYECPRGFYCPVGSSFPLGCAPGLYNPSEAMEECVDCLPGSICPGNTTSPEDCPIYHYCPAGSATGVPCPTGTYGSRTDLESASECSPCPARYFCLDGNITSTCRAGYFCKTGAGDPTPNSEYANITYEEYNDLWEALDAGPCPAGHYCPPGTEDPVQCANASVRVSLLGVSADDCGSCAAGFVCYPGNPIPEQCYRGYYCPQGEDPIPCPIGTYNPLVEQDERDDCIACPAGSSCNVEGIGDFAQYPCPAGHFCLVREEDPEECPVGTFRNNTGATSVEDCHDCPGGFRCGAGSVTPDSCPEKTYCPVGSSNTTTCPAGFYCPVETSEPIVCPGGYYCPLGVSEPEICVLGTYCPEGSGIFIPCPLGWYGSVTSSNTLGLRDDACAECPPGTYGADPDRLVCETCPEGYVCLGGTTSATPVSADKDGGFLCTPGHYCPAGSYEEIPCPAGSYNPEAGSSAASACIVCTAGHYQDRAGSFSCLPCSSSSTSEANATSCRCLGLNRAFQLSDGQCICKSGYEYYNEGGVLVSTLDGAVDCQPIVFDRCYTGEALDADGVCLSESDCDAQCGDAGGTFYEHIGICECNGQQDLNAVCDVTCRDNAALMFVDPLTGLIVIVDGNTTDYVDPADLPSFAGALYCTDDAGCGLFPVTVSTNFSGVYGTGTAVATAVTEVLATADPSIPSSRRHRLLTATVPPGVGDGGRGSRGNSTVGVNEFESGDGDDNYRLSAVRKGGACDPSTSEQDMVDIFLRRRTSNYRPRNQYRDRFFNENGTHTTIPGAIPKSQRAYTTSTLSSTKRRDSFPQYSQGEGEGEGSAPPLPHREQQQQGRPDDDRDVEAGDEGFDSYGPSRWEQANRKTAVRGNGQAKENAWKSKEKGRRLAGTVSFAEPAIESPLSCFRRGDSVIFDISSGCYPVYEKDSLLNSNAEFDYGEFRSMAELAASSATYDTFGFVFEDAGTYVFSTSCNAASIIVLAVMGEDISCTTDAQFVPLTAANLIKLGVSKNSDNITLAPDWALIGGLLAGVAFMVFGVVSAVYYFRTKAWTTGQAAIPEYRAKAQASKLKGVTEPARHKPGFFTKRQTQVTPSEAVALGDDGAGISSLLQPRLSVSARSGHFSGSHGEDIEMQSEHGHALDGAQNNSNVRELVERMQKYHDDVEKEFTGQKDLVLKLHHLLQQEADELKRLLGAKAGEIGQQPTAAVERSTRAALARIKNDLVSRRLHEAGASTSEVEALSALKRLQELLREGAEPFAKRVMQEISNPEIAGRGSTHDDAQASTPLLREIQEGAELITVEVVKELGESLERERQREQSARTVLEGAVYMGGVVLPEDIVRNLKTLSEMDARVDSGGRTVATTLKRLAERLPVCTRELCASEGLILRNLERLRAMGNIPLEAAERQRGQQAIAAVLEQLIQALAIVGAKAEAEKAAVDTARIDAEVERRHLEEAVDEGIKTLDIAGVSDCAPPATSDDLQGMLKEIRTLVASTCSPAPAPDVAVVEPTRRASALFSQVAENELRRHSIPYGEAVDNSPVAEKEAEAVARQLEVEASLLAEQEAGVAVVSAVTESQKKSLEEELENAGASAEEKQAMMVALAEDQKAIEDILEGERMRMEESFRSAAAARKARDDKHAEEDAIEESQTKTELLSKQNAQLKELRRKYEAAQLAAVQEEFADDDEREGGHEPDGGEGKDCDTEKEAGGTGNDAEDVDGGGLVAGLRKAHSRQIALLDSSLTAKANSAKRALRDRLAAQRAKREAGLVEKGDSASEAAMKADKELADQEEAQQEELEARMSAEKRDAVNAEASTQREVLDEARAAARDIKKDPAGARKATENEAQRIREQAEEAIEAFEEAMADEGRVRRQALKERLKAKRRAKEAELERMGAGEKERCDQDADLTRLEELETEALEEKLHAEKESGLKEVRACAAAAEAAATVASKRAAGNDELDPQAGVTSRKMKELHLAALEKLEHDLGRKEKSASRALRERLQVAREVRATTLQEKESLSYSEAAKRAREELEDGEEKALEELMEELVSDRTEAIGRAKLEAEAAAAASMREEADRLLDEHRDRMQQLQEEMKVDAKRQKANLQKRLAARRLATEAVVAAARPVSEEAAAKAAALADLAAEVESNALEKSLLDEANRVKSEAERYEMSVENLVTAADEAAAAAAGAVAAVTAAAEAAAAAATTGPETGGGAAPVGEEAAAAAAAATATATEETKESLRAVHERAIAAMELQIESKRRAAAGKLAQRKAAARAARAEAMRAEGKSVEEITKQLAEDGARDAQEAAQEDARLQAAGVNEIEKERAAQMAAVADGADPREEAARIRERHLRDTAALEKELEQHCRDQRVGLSIRLRKRKAAREEALRRAGAGEEETAAAIKALDFEAERDAIQLEEALNSLKATATAGEKHALALASGEEENPEMVLAELRARHQESENRLKDALRAEAGARRARTRQRIAARAAARVKELEAQGRSRDEIAAEEAAVRAAGEAEEAKLEAVLATESAARIQAAREAALEEEAGLKARQEETRDLRKNHEKAVAELMAEMTEKKRRGKEGVAARLRERKARRAAEMDESKAKKEEVAAELARLDQDSKEEEKRIEAEIDQEAALLAQAELKMHAKREAEARAARLTADSSRRAGEAELERIRREHEEHQRILEEAQESKRKLRQRALAERLERRRQEKMNAAIAAAESAESQQKLAASLAEEKIAAEAELEEELVKEACRELEMNAQRQSRAEQAARASAQAAIDEAEKRARLAREEHERSTKELDEQLAAAKVARGSKLKERLAKKRKDREDQLARENADAEAVKEARRKMEEEEQRELQRLDEHLAKERERLHAENLARATARRAREEAEARDKAAAAAEAANLAKQEAVDCLHRLQKQHAEQHAALERQMQEEKRSREGKLRERLAKKRKAKEAEIEQTVLSEREKQAEQKRLEEEERAERQRFHDQLEEETKKSIDAQRRQQEEAMAIAAAEAAKMSELAAAASARAAAADAVREAAEAAEQEEFRRKAQKLKELSQANEEKERAALAGSSAATKSRLMDRLAQKKAKAEAKKRGLEAAQKLEEERLLAKHKEEVEAAKAAAAPGWTGNIAWDEAVTVAMAEEPRRGETQSGREARVLKSVLEADIVPENKIGKCVELVMATRHERESADLLTTQYKERASRLATSLGKLLIEKNAARTEALQRLAKAMTTDEEKAQASAEIDDDFAGRQQDLETAIIQELEPVHLEQQLKLRQQQLQEIAETFRSIAPESALKRLQEINAARQQQELEDFQAAMEREKEDRLRRLQEEREKFEEQLRQRHEEEMRRLQAEEDKVMNVEREAQEARLRAKEAELAEQREEERRKMEERSDQLNAEQKEALLEKFRVDQAAELGALKAEEVASKSKLEQKLAARRKKKMDELRTREERQLKEKEARDAKRLEEIEKQANLEKAAEIRALAASASVSGLKVDIDKEAILLAREAGGTNEGKERLREALAANQLRKMAQRHNSMGSLSDAGGGATAAAAAAAATAAAATAYSHISAKLEGIEALISALKAAQGDNRLPAPDRQASQTSGGSPTQVYRDAEDEAMIPEGDDLQIIPREQLPVQALARLDFGEHLLSVLGLADTVKLRIAKNLPPRAGGDGDGGDNNANAFRNSYFWDMSSGVLNIHVRRLSSSGDFGLVLVHAVAHIQVNPLDMSNDLDPRFTRHFHRSLKVLTQELFKSREAAAPAAGSSFGSPRKSPHSSALEGGKGPTLKVGGVQPKQNRFVAASGDFAQDRIAERMEKYAKASGDPRLVELLSRHANDQKDKFTLSDDEEEVSNVGDAEYMENYDNEDADSIFRSPEASLITG